MSTEEKLYQFSVNITEETMLRVEELAIQLRMARGAIIRKIIEQFFKWVDEGKIKIRDIFEME